LKPILKPVAVRALCEFTAKCGDLDLRFTPSPSAQEGIAGHQWVQARRAADYETEIVLSGSYGALEVRGRADGYCPRQHQLEEIKTYRGQFENIPTNHQTLHWAQAKVYASLMCEKLNLSEIQVALVYFNIGTQIETVLQERFEAVQLRAFFDECCRQYLVWAEQESSHLIARDVALSALQFPHQEFRTGQRELAEMVYRVNQRKPNNPSTLLVQAPTGIGKTIATIFPVLKALPVQSIDKLFFLTAKTPGRQLALDGFTLIRQAAPTNLPLRVVELIARDKACEHLDKACHGQSCPLANGFYDRLAGARAAAIERSTSVELSHPVLREIALAHQVCPYYLGQEMVRWADAVVGDYNYYFDVSAMLYGWTRAEQWRASLLVDEAHNLLERARKMYSAQLEQASFKALRLSIPKSLKRPFDQVNRQWNTIVKEQCEEYVVYDAIPDAFLRVLTDCCAAIGDYFSEHPQVIDQALQRFYFDALAFLNLSEVFASHALFDVTLVAPLANASVLEKERVRSVLCIRNVIPAVHLTERFKGAHASVLFSATLSPANAVVQLLGLAPNTAWLDVESPFRAEQLEVNVLRGVSTRYADRAASLSTVVQTIAQQYQKTPGNYLAFFSSYAYLQQAVDLFRERYPGIVCWVQERSMDEAARNEFLANFQTESVIEAKFESAVESTVESTVESELKPDSGIGFAVLGGAFGEGIDLAGSRLIGAFVATLGMPQVNPVNEQMKQRIQACLGSGFEHVYLYPGIQKVVQAAGRVIRTPEDRGVLYLLDERFAASDIRELLPAWWRVGVVPYFGKDGAPGLWP
jgi:DNA excision repair protein ERCC-2